MFVSDRRFIAMIFGVTFLTFAACTPQSGLQPNTGDGQTPKTEKNVAGTKWKLFSFGEPGKETPLVEGSSITLEFDVEGQAGGSGGCNSYSARYDVQENQLSFGEINHTLMACEQEGINQQEQDYFQALEAAGKFKLTGDRLTIWYDDGQQDMLNFVKLKGPSPSG